MHSLSRENKTKSLSWQGCGPEQRKAPIGKWNDTASLYPGQCRDKGSFARFLEHPERLYEVGKTGFFL